MLTLTLVAMSQIAAPEPAVNAPPPEKGHLAWVIITPMAAGMAGGIAAIHAYNASAGAQTDYGTALLTMMLGAVVGTGLGVLAGWFARDGNTQAKVASVLLW